MSRTIKVVLGLLAVLGTLCGMAQSVMPGRQPLAPLSPSLPALAAAALPGSPGEAAASPLHVRARAADTAEQLGHTPIQTDAAALFRARWAGGREDLRSYLTNSAAMQRRQPPAKCQSPPDPTDQSSIAAWEMMCQ